MKVIKIKYSRDEMNVLLNYLSIYAQLQLVHHCDRCMQSVIRRMVQRIMNKLFKRQDSYKLSWNEDAAHAMVAFYESQDFYMDAYSINTIRTTYEQLKQQL